VEEALAVAGRVDHRPCRVIHISDLDPGPHRGARRLLGSPDDGVDLDELRIGLPHRHGASRVAAVPVQDAAEIEDQRIAELEGAIPRLVMWRRRIRTGCDDREVDALVPVGKQQLRQIRRDVTLTATGERHAQHLAEGGVGAFYYAGHGLQVRGRNYLVPVNAEIEDEASTRVAAVDVELLLEQMAEAKNRVDARGMVGDPRNAVNRLSQGATYAYGVDAVFEGARGVGTRTDHVRPCSLTFVK